MKKLLAVSAVTVLMASPALAADPIHPTPVPVAPIVDSSSVWDGFYAGLNAGYGWGRGEATSAGIGYAGGDDVNGWLGGGQVGYNFASDGIVFGVETDLQLANINYSDTIFGYTGDVGLQAFGTLRARVGVDAGDFMPYLTAGLAYGKVGYDISPVGGGAPLTDSKWSLGWAAGAGVEAMVADNISLKGEYLYLDIGSTALDITGTPFDVKGHAHTARIGLNFHF